jgi:hypothetical protein
MIWNVSGKTPIYTEFSSVQGDVGPYDRRVRAKTPLPIPMAEQDDCGRAGLIFFRQECAADQGSNAKRGE